MNRIVTLSLLLLFGASTLFAAAAEPLLVKLENCPAGSARVYPYLLYEDRNGDGLYDYVVAGACDGTTKGRPLGNVTADPFAPTPFDTTVCELPAGALPDSVRLHAVGLLSNGRYVWTVTEYHQGAAVCSYSRMADGTMATTCPPSGGLGMIESGDL